MRCVRRSYLVLKTSQLGLMLWLESGKWSGSLSLPVAIWPLHCHLEFLRGLRLGKPPLRGHAQWCCLHGDGQLNDNYTTGAHNVVSIQIVILHNNPNTNKPSTQIRFVFTRKVPPKRHPETKHPLRFLHPSPRSRVNPRRGGTPWPRSLDPALKHAAERGLQRSS